jgi:hypothetical protein
MDVYRAINADVPQLLFTVLQQAPPTVSDEEFIRTASSLQMDFRNQAHEMSELLHLWLARHYKQQAEETVQKLKRLGMLSAQADVPEAQQVLERDFSRLGSRLSSEIMIGMQGSAVETFSEETPSDPDLAQHVADGREYLTSLGFKPGQGHLHETWLLFRGSIHYDIIEHIVRGRMNIDTGNFNKHSENVERTSFSTYTLVYQLGESLTTDLNIDGTQEVTFAFSKGLIHYGQFRQEVSALMEEVGDSMNPIHASFWQRKLGLGSGKEFVLRLRLPAGVTQLKDALSEIADAGRLGKEVIVKRGKLILGKRLM